MDCFDMYDKFVKADDEAMTKQLQAQAENDADNLWDDNQPPTEENRGIDQSQAAAEKTPNLSDADITAIAAKMVELMGQKGGSDGDAGNDRHDAE